MNNSNCDRIHELLWSRAYSYAFEIALNIELFSFLNKEPVALYEISKFAEMPLSSTRILLQYLCSLDLVVYSNNMFSNTQLSQWLISQEDLINGLKGFAPDSLKGFHGKLTKPGNQPWYQIQNEGVPIDQTEGIDEGFFISKFRHEWRTNQGIALSYEYDFSKHDTLLDIGCASGGWSMGIRQNNKQLKCLLFDTPEVSRLTSKLLSDYLKDDEIKVIAGDMFDLKINEPFDLALLANVLHDWSIEDGTKIAKLIYEKLPHNGVLLISEYFFENDWNGPLSSLFHAVTVLGPDGKSGWQPTYGEMEKLLLAAGFETVERRNNLVIATKK
jgi:2-polyprenyl-3-methyl-5-hydroxy-6-metoxy-1,4-benzoquinol methylase